MQVYTVVINSDIGESRHTILSGNLWDAADEAIDYHINESVAPTERMTVEVVRQAS